MPSSNSRTLLSSYPSPNAPPCMALCHPSLFSSTLSPLLKPGEPHHGWKSHRFPPTRSLVLACSAEKSWKKGKASRPTKSNAEICNEIREFVLQMGLPVDRVPSTKELAEHGRNDLANIVRRRGYKVITELLKNSENVDSYTEERLVRNENSGNSCKHEASEHQLTDLKEPAECAFLSSADASLIRKYTNSKNGAMGMNSSIEISEPSESPIGSLHVKATNFIQTGELDPLEDTSDIEDADMPYFSELYSVFSNGVDRDAEVSTQVPSLLTEQHQDRSDFASSEGQNNIDLDENLASDMAGERDNQAEINHLKDVLHQKESELVLLKEQIEKEKLALSTLQARANTEIGNAQRIISAKDVELRAAEEDLLGLKEVQIEYWANGEIVEVAGSFNGWHNRIKMDLHPSSKTANQVNYRNTKLWSTVLWLYLGIYEIKFIVDGHWRIDTQREPTERQRVASVEARLTPLRIPCTSDLCGSILARMGSYPTVVTSATAKHG